MVVHVSITSSTCSFLLIFIANNKTLHFEFAVYENRTQCPKEKPFLTDVSVDSCKSGLLTNHYKYYCFTNSMPVCLSGRGKILYDAYHITH